MRRLFLSFAFLLHVPISAAIPATEAPESNQYADFDRDYRIILPENWQAKRGFMGMDIFAAAPDENGQLGSRANMSVVSGTIPGGLTLDTVLAKSLEDLKGKLQDFKLIETGKVFLEGTEGRKLVYTFKDQDVAIRVTQYFVLHQDKVYIITNGAATDVADKYRDAFDKSVKSFKIMNAP